jgi:TPR repeat protein
MKLPVFIATVIVLTSLNLSAQSGSAWYPIAKWSSSSIVCQNADDRAKLAERAEKGDAVAQDALGTQYLSNCQGQDLVKGADLLTRSAAQGNAHAELELGKAYKVGVGLKLNVPAAVAWLEKSAAQGIPQAQNDLGVFYMSGDAVPKDYARAFKLFQAAAEQDLSEAAYNLATMYDQGHGTTQDYQSARKYYQQAAEREASDSEYRLALLWEQGLGGEKDQAMASRWLNRAAKDGSEEAQVKLGLKSPAQAHTVNSGYFQFEIAKAMFEGKGMAKDQTGARKMVEKSAEIGYPPAFLALGRMYARGDSVPKDEAKGIGYMEQAIARDPKYDEAYNALAWILLTSEDLKLRNPQKARDYALKAVEIGGGNKDYQLDTLAHAYFDLGDIDRAVELEAQALSLKPDSDLYKKSLSEYKRAQESPATAK